jgi:hypothetical protein
MRSWAQVALQGHFLDLEKKKGVLRLPIDVILYIAKNLEDYDIVSLALTNKYFYKILHEIIHKISHKCISSVEHGWNAMVPEAMSLCRLKLKRYKSDSFTWQVSQKDEVECLCFRNKFHYISITYVHNPYDVDLLAWYENGLKMGYSLL